MSITFEEFLKNEKGITYEGINSRVSRLRWVEDACRLSANVMVKSVQTMFDCRKKIYSAETNGHRAGNYYNALKLYYEYINGEECPRINSKSHVKNLR